MKTDRIIEHTYDIEADWRINSFCNFKCEYCPTRSDVEHPNVGLILPAEYCEFFEQTGLRWHLHFTGGEPFFYPSFVELCRALSRLHVLSVNSNLSTSNVYEFAETVDPSRVEFIHAGVHIDERFQRSGLSPLLRKVERLLKAGFGLFASSVMTPSAYSRFSMVQAAFHEMSVPLFPKALRGPYKGLPYPAAYLECERRQFREFSHSAEVLWQTAGLKQRPTINLSLDANFLDGFPNFKGRLCSAGVESVSISPDGTIYRCGRKTIIGSIPQRQLHLLQQADRCDNHACPYVCLKRTRLSLSDAKSLARENVLVQIGT